MNDENYDAKLESTSRWTSFRAFCHSVHEDGSGPYAGDWRSSAEQAQVDGDAHDQEKHAGLPFAKVDFK